MRKLLGCLVAVALLAFVCSGTNPTVKAQDKKDKDTKKDKKDARKGGPGTVEIGEGKDGKFRLTIRDAEGKFLAVSAPHTTEKEAREAIDELREALTKAKVVVKKAEKDKKDKEK